MQHSEACSVTTELHHLARKEPRVFRPVPGLRPPQRMLAADVWEALAGPMLDAPSPPWQFSDAPECKCQAHVHAFDCASQSFFSCRRATAGFGTKAKSTDVCFHVGFQGRTGNVSNGTNPSLLTRSRSRESGPVQRQHPCRDAECLNPLLSRLLSQVLSCELSSS
jgi:hypothetical protein